MIRAKLEINEEFVLLGWFNKDPLIKRLHPKNRGFSEVCPFNSKE